MEEARLERHILKQIFTRIRILMFSHYRYSYIPTFLYFSIIFSYFYIFIFLYLHYLHLYSHSYIYIYILTLLLFLYSIFPMTYFYIL